MPMIRYVSTRFQEKSLEIIRKANEIIDEYATNGYDLTLRQLYYQFVARDFLANNQQNYKRLGSIINDARLAGLVDWERIEDRTRGIETLNTWEDPAEIVAAVARQYRVDLWKGQPRRIEVWIEKEALAGVFQRVCQELRISYLSCRGYTSASEMWRAAERLKGYTRDGQRAVILHFGDHDPSGIGMGEDIKNRLTIFGARFDYHRLALNMDQVEEYGPPPNPAKETDSRFADYKATFDTEESWELDALDPAVLSGLVRDFAENVINQKLWKAAVKEEEEGKRLLQAVSDDWENLTEGL